MSQIDLKNPAAGVTMTYKKWDKMKDSFEIILHCIEKQTEPLLITGLKEIPEGDGIKYQIEANTPHCKSTLPNHSLTTTSLSGHLYRGDHDLHEG